MSGTGGFADDPALAGATEEAGFAPEGMDPLFPDLEQPSSPGVPVPGHGTIHDAVIADIRDRAAKGEREYGGKHYLRNGLDGLTEAYEEALDMAFWLRQEIEERKLAASGDPELRYAAMDRITESNEARRDERERILTAGAGLIAAERERQVSEEGWTTEHDAAHGEGVLARAGACYAWYAAMGYRLSPVTSWPWDEHWWKPGDDPVRTLAKAGALIAAEIDRLAAAAGDPK